MFLATGNAENLIVAYNEAGVYAGIVIIFAAGQHSQGHDKDNDTFCNLALRPRFYALRAMVALAVTTTLISFGKEKGTGKIFGHTLLYTLHILSR